jgi:hypothetical protein
MTVQITALAVVALLMAPGCSKEKPRTESKAAAPQVEAQPPVLIEPGAGVDAVQKGMNKEDVEAALGKPEDINSKWWFYLNRGMVVAFGDNGVVFNIKFFGPFSGVTKECICNGSTRAELIAAFGNPSQEKQLQGKESGAVIPGSARAVPGATYDNLWFAAPRVSFNLQNDKVTSFIVHL